MAWAHWGLLVVTLAIGACNGRDRAERAPDTAGMEGHMDSGGMGMGRMNSGGMAMGGTPMQGRQMMSGMRAHMDSMMRMSPQQMQAMMAMHQRMMSQMLDGMGADMRGMRMSGTREWNALTDSVKQDLAELPNLKGQELSARMRSHADRGTRLIGMHEAMMRR